MGYQESVEIYYGWPSVLHSHWTHPVFSTFDLYSENTSCWRLNRLALAIHYDILYVFVLLEMRESGGFPTFLFYLCDF